MITHALPTLSQLQEEGAGLPVGHVRETLLVFLLQMKSGKRSWPTYKQKRAKEARRARKQRGEVISFAFVPSMRKALQSNLL